MPSTVEADKDFVATCPHCEKKLDTIIASRIPTNLGVAYLYACQACEKSLGISHRKGFWMG